MRLNGLTGLTFGSEHRGQRACGADFGPIITEDRSKRALQKSRGVAEYFPASSNHCVKRPKSRRCGSLPKRRSWSEEEPSQCDCDQRATHEFAPGSK